MEFFRRASVLISMQERAMRRPVLARIHAPHKGDLIIQAARNSPIQTLFPASPADAHSPAGCFCSAGDVQIRQAPREPLPESLAQHGFPASCSRTWRGYFKWRRVSPRLMLANPARLFKWRRVSPRLMPANLTRLFNWRRVSPRLMLANLARLFKRRRVSPRLMLAEMTAVQTAPCKGEPPERVFQRRRFVFITSGAAARQTRA